MPTTKKPVRKLLRQNLHLIKQLHPEISKRQVLALRDITTKLGVSVAGGELVLIDGAWYVTHSGLLRIAARKRCLGMRAQLISDFCDINSSRFAFRAIVYTTPTCKGFVGYGDADPSNVSPLVHGAEMRVAETRAVNRALRKAYGIGICSVEEIGTLSRESESAKQPKKLPPQPANGNGYGGPKLRDRLCQLIRQHQLDGELVKAYATDFCGVKTLREASREQVENFVQHLADWAEKDRNALLCQLNSYLPRKD
jgi:hypothetical protein